MELEDYLLLPQKIISLFPFTFLDIVVIVSALIFIASEKQREFVKSFIITAFTGATWLIGIALYLPLSMYLQTQLISSKGASDGISLMIILIVFGAIFGIVYRLFVLNADQQLLLKKIPIINGMFGAITFAIIISALTTLNLSFPVTPFIKETINQSVLLRSLSSFTQSLESYERKILGQSGVYTLNFLTVDSSNVNGERITENKFYLPVEAKNELVVSEINRIRKNVGSTSVSERDSLSTIAQTLASRMAVNGQISRAEIGGNTPFDLLSAQRLPYSRVYFMVAQAQSVPIAIQGLTQIPQYASELTSNRYASVGVSVVSLKEHGYIVTLLFTD